MPQKNGFTLIEILVVMSILGILLSGLIISINPAEQIAKSKDSNRQTAVLALGKAIYSYSINNNTQTNIFPTANNTWQDILAQSGEINEPIQANQITNGLCTANSQGNICYITNGTNAIVWTIAESLNSKKNAGGACSSNPSSNYAAYAWIALKGRIGLTCLGASPENVPTYTAALN